MSVTFACPVCGETAMEDGDHVICGACGWENDPVQLADKALAGGANTLSLNEARIQWRATGKQVR